ncbi:MAG: glycosyltransferase family 2 protein [Rhodospirillaceae bacterium]|nr:glycosyltransferase family 2 protein [Rhodospirillaceae bacterium]
MSISVIIPAYKAVQTIERALACVAAQTLKPDEVIVVDDGSQDGTLKAAQAFKDKMDAIDLKVISQENLGAGAARNRAIEEASGTWLAFLDADDEWLPEKLATSMQAINEHGLTLLAHNYLAIKGADETLVDCAARYRAAMDPYIGLYRKGFLATSTIVVRRDAVLEAGCFDETLATAQDFDLWLKILKEEGAAFLVKPDTLMRYHITAGSITSHTARRLECSLRIAKRHAPNRIDHGYRITAVHLEAITSSLAQGRPLATLGYLLQLPARLLATFS